MQALCASLALPASIVPSLVAILRDHSPSLRLPCESRRVLTTLRGGWKIGILTNGTPEIQRRKVAALGLAALVDAVVFADRSAATDAANRRRPRFARRSTGSVVAPERTVFVGDDAHADIAGAAASGCRRFTCWRTGRRRPTCGRRAAARTSGRLGDVPHIANAARAIEDGVSCRLRLADGGSASGSRCS